MTPEEHNKTLGICHLAYGGFYTLIMLAMFGFMWAVFSAIPTRPGAPDENFPLVILPFFFLFMFVYSLIFTLPSFIAGYAMLKRKEWARTASIVASVMETMSVPIGTAVAVYSFWFMFSDAGKAFYEKNKARPQQQQQRPFALHDAPPPASDWNAQTNFGREQEYAPPAQPPDWRNE
ncbi:MAG TPA: hypothetical protein VJ842_08550 [Pyrinomonadaceae bacterium]|nr:hypothetical protein [Pyrinomonadaceae bacterium]